MHAARRVQIVATFAFVMALAALIEDIDILSVIVGTTATALFVIVMTAREATPWQQYLFEAATVPLRGPFQVVTDLLRSSSQLTKDRLPEWLRTRSLIAWIVPLGAFALFLYLFASANPLIEARLMQIDFRSIADLLDPWRVMLWILVVCTTWPLIVRHIPKWPDLARDPAVASVPQPFDWDMFFGAPALLRSLILFNLLFALQSALDLAYLWGGANLPNGMSHAEYAHRGAYPLVVTALLAASFLLIAMRPGGPAETSRLIRPLVLVWTAQNVLLVISSIFRLDLYVAAYSLTYLRLAAFIWMALVAIGLVLIVIQIELKKSNSWLLSANAISLALALYACCFINAPWLVASYNVEHSREAGGTGPNLDLKYLASLGPQALPAVEAHVESVPGLGSIARDYRHDSQTRTDQGNWRTWGFRTWRLQRYLANNPDTSPNPRDNGKG